MKRLTLFLTISFGGAWLLQALAIGSLSLLPAELQAVVFQVPVALSMFMPLIATVITCRGISTARTGILWGLRLRGRIKWVVAAFFGPFVLIVLGAVLYFALFPGDFTPVGGLYTLLIPADQQEALPFAPEILVLITLVSAVTYAPFINTFFAVGEEAGWRGFMVPLLMQKVGRKPGLVLGGIIWGVWHWPLIIFTGYQYGAGYPGAPFTGLAAMCLFTVVIGILLQFLYEKSGSIWIPSLAHGALNAAAALPLYIMPVGTTHYLLGPTIAGVVSVLPALLVALVVFFRKKCQSTDNPESTSLMPESTSLT